MRRIDSFSMVRKELREMERKSVQADGDSAPSADIFKSLFGSDNATLPSIFSDENPFKRKSCEHTTGNEIETRKAKKKNRKENVDTVGDDRELERKKNRLNAQMENATEMRHEESDEKKDGKKKKRKREEVAKEFEGLNLVENKMDSGAVAGSVVIGTKRKNADREDVDKMLTKEEGEEGFDDEEKLLRTVFLGNLPLKVKKKLLLKEFSKFGEIESIRIRSIPLIDTKIPRKGAVLLKKINKEADNVHAYIVFKNQQSAEDALSYNMNVIGGNHIRVDRACPPRKKLKGGASPHYDIQRTVFLGNLPFDVKDEEVYQLFSNIKDLESSIEGVRVIRDPQGGIGKGFAYLLLKTKDAAKLVVRNKNLAIRGRELRVVPAKQNSTPSKRNPTTTSAEDSHSSKKNRSAFDTPQRSVESKSRGAMSYQGLRGNKAKNASKLGIKKEVGKGKPLPHKSKKRPAVTARKARELADNNRKRKLDSRTPESSIRKNGAKRFRR